MRFLSENQQWRFEIPCNAVATARAQVSQENLAKLLTDDVVRMVVSDYLNRKYGHLNPRESDDFRSRGVMFIMGSFHIYIDRGNVSVSSTVRTSEEQAAIKSLAADITAFLTRAAGVLFQQKVRQAIASRYAIGEAQFTPNGALVLSVEL